MEGGMRRVTDEMAGDMPGKPVRCGGRVMDGAPMPRDAEADDRGDATGHRPACEWAKARAEAWRGGMGAVGVGPTTGVDAGDAPGAMVGRDGGAGLAALG